MENSFVMVHLSQFVVTLFFSQNNSIQIFQSDFRTILALDWACFLNNLSLYFPDSLGSSDGHLNKLSYFVIEVVLYNNIVVLSILLIVLC